MTAPKRARQPGASVTREAMTVEDFHGFRDLAFQAAGLHLGEHKQELAQSRLAKRLRHLGFGSYRQYLHLLRHDDPTGAELREMVNCLTTNKTSFFRERHHFDWLAQHYWTQAGDRNPLRIWSAGCSTGEEPYSIAMSAATHHARVEVVASDIDTAVLARAAAGIYPATLLEHLPSSEWQPFFRNGKGARAGFVQVRPEIRQRVDFRHVNLVDPRWNHTDKFDVIMCRNVIIYFQRETQATLMERFANHLRPGGCLILGHSENLNWMLDTFEPIGNTIYRLRDSRQQRPLQPPRSREERIIAGGILASAQPTVIRTLLGSCVAACIFDPGTGVGGMNHFMLPMGHQDDKMPSRYGVHAMEVLINEVMKAGGDRRRLQAKVFGAAGVLRGMTAGPQVAQQNARFVRHFLKREGIPIVGERLGGTKPLEVRFHTHSGKAAIRALSGTTATDAAVDEERYRTQIVNESATPVAADVTLF